MLHEPLKNVLAQSLSSRPSGRDQRGGGTDTPWRLRRSRHLAQLASRFVSRLVSRQCTQMPKNGAERSFLAICVHYCVPTVARTILARRNSVHECPKTARRSPILPFVYTIAIPRLPTTQARVATVYTNAPKRHRGAILANLCTLLCRRPGGEAHAARAVTQPSTHTNSRSLVFHVSSLCPSGHPDVNKLEQEVEERDK